MKRMLRLDDSTLHDLGDVPVPTYDRGRATVGIVHFGVGNFHRSHQAAYLDRLMASGLGLDWGICGVGLLPQDARMRDVMAAQDRLYTLVLRHPDGTNEPRVIGSILDYLYAPDDPDAVLDRLVDPAVRIVTLTVTEGGYLKDPLSGRFDADDPSVRYDLEHPTAPSTAFAYIVEGLRRRRAAAIEPFTVLSCDNLQGNGRATRRAVLGFAGLSDDELASWIAHTVAFPDCMVDRITPATTDEDRLAVSSILGVEDGWPVPAEPFTQWIVTDTFPAGRPDFASVGVQFVDDVTPYELMKLRLLNGCHQAIAYFGALLGHVTVDEAVRDERIRQYLLAYMGREAAPTLPDLPGIDLGHYMTTVVERFGNPQVRDTLVRIATDGANRMGTFTLPVLQDNVMAGRPVPLGAAMVAAWAQFWATIGTGTSPSSGVPQDVHASALIAAATSPDPAAFIENRTLFGDLARNDRFRAAFVDARTRLAAEGVHATLDMLLATT